MCVCVCVCVYVCLCVCAYVSLSTREEAMLTPGKLSDCWLEGTVDVVLGAPRTMFSVDITPTLLVRTDRYTVAMFTFHVVTAAARSNCA